MVYNKLMLSSGVFRVFLLRDDFSRTIKTTRAFRKSAYTSAVLLSLLILAILCPISFRSATPTEAATKNPNPSTLTFAFTNNRNTASVSLAVTDKNGNFATSTDSQKASFSLSTNNATGYTLNLRTTGTTTTLSDGTHSINTISSSGITADNFAVNTYGILPSKYNGIANTANYYPASSTGFKMDETSTANTTANTYTVGLGLKANYATAAGTYTTASTDNGNTGASLVLEYVANAVTYSINYYTNTTATVTGMPSINPQTGTVSQGTTSTSVNLASAPSRTGYTFVGWCKGTNATTSNITVKTDGTPDVCNSTSYDAGQSFGIDATVSPDTYYLFAMWKRNSYTCTKQYRLENADGTWGSYTGDGTEQVLYGDTCNYSKTVTNYKNSASGTNNSTASTSGTMGTSGLTLQLSFYRNTYALTVSAGTNTSSPTGGGTYRWGQTVAVGVTKSSNVTCTSYATPTWTQSGTAGTFSSTSGTSVNFTMGKGAATVTATSTASNVAQTITLSRSNASSITIAGTTYTGSSVSLNCGTYNISGAYPTGYSFSSWSRANGVAVGSTSSASTTMTVTGAGTLTLNGKASQYNLVVTGDANVSAMSVKAGSTSGTSTTCTKSGTKFTCSNLTYGTSYYLYPTFNTGYEFSSWAKTDSATNASLGSTSTMNTYYKMGAGAGALTLASKVSEINYCTQNGIADANCMQEMTTSNCTSSNKTVTDARDGKTYTVKLINGQCWMTQNLRFTGTSVKSTLSNVTSNKTLTYYQLDTDGDASDEKCNGDTGYSNACIKDSGSTSTGVWYNYYAATAGTVSGSSNSTAASQDICPKNWHLPTGANTTANTDFNKIVGNTTAGFQNPTTGLTSFGAVAGGRYDNGSLSSTGYGYWWSATANNTTSRYRLGYNSSNGQFGGNGNNYRYLGLFVRCVRST